MWFIETTYKPYSVMDIYHGNYVDPSLGVFAQTHFYSGNYEVYPWNQDYGWTRIYLNSPTFESLSTYWWTGSTYINQKKGVIAHEMGHVFGLTHAGWSYRLMWPHGDSVMVDYPTSDEINGVNALYP